MLEMLKGRLAELEHAKEQCVMSYNKIIGAIEETKNHVEHAIKIGTGHVEQESVEMTDLVDQALDQ